MSSDLQIPSIMYILTCVSMHPQKHMRTHIHAHAVFYFREERKEELRVHLDDAVLSTHEALGSIARTK